MDEMDASLLGLEGDAGDKLEDGNGEETEVVKERFTSLPDEIPASSTLKHRKA